MTVQYEKGEQDVRPWGTWEVLDTGGLYAVKKIHVSPGEQLSYQVHEHRDEHWIVVAGVGRVTLNDKFIDVTVNDHVFIKAGENHRIANPGTGVLAFIEVQVGDLLDENDITRLDDDYNR